MITESPTPQTPDERDGAAEPPVWTPEPNAPEHLIPSIDRPQDAHFFTSVVITDMDAIDAGERPIDAPLDEMQVAGTTGAVRPAEGVILTHRQAWESSGLALGNLLHSLTLAPGEVTRVAMIDWHHRARGQQSGSTSQADHLAQAGEQSRSVAEITKGVASEHQSGVSVGTASSSSAQGGAGGGLFGFLGFSASGGSNHSIATNVSFSAGDREVSQTANQRLHQRTHQHADAVRTKRATVVKETSESDDETLSTRIVANYNHGHALNVQYFEVLETYALKTRVVDAERCLFIPMAPYDFSDPRVLHRHRDLLRRLAHTPELAALLDEVQPAEDSVQLDFPPQAAADLGDLREALAEDPKRDMSPIDGFLYGLGLETRDRAPRRTIPGAAAQSEQILRLPAGATLVGMGAPGFDAGLDRLRQAGVLSVRLRHVSDQLPPEVSRLPREGLQVADIAEIVFSPNPLSAAQSTREHLAKIELQFRSASGHQSSQSTLLAVRSSEGPLVIARVSPPDLPNAERIGALMAPLRLAYSQAIWASMDQVSLRELLAGYSHDGQPLGDSLVPIPIAISGNLLGFRWPFPSTRARTRDSFRKRHTEQVGVSDLVSVPTGGVFAEAVLGQSKAAELIDPHRFWKWQDSPIPLTPPEIKPLDSSPRGSGVDTGAPSLEASAATPLAMPAMPAFGGSGEALKALVTANMFRDMSGMAQVASMLETAVGASSSGATAAGEQASKNFETYTQYLQAMVEQLAPLVEGALSDGASTALTETMKGGMAAKKAAAGTAAKSAPRKPAAKPAVEPAVKPEIKAKAEPKPEVKAKTKPKN